PISLALLSNIQDQTRISLSPPSDIRCLLFLRLLGRGYISVDTQAHVGGGGGVWLWMQCWVRTQMCGYVLLDT
ncbi:unnamed protein product, partial [Brassica oleracea var. botrytis]